MIQFFMILFYFQISRGNLIISKWNDCGMYFAYVQQAYIDWSSRPILFNRTRKIIGATKSFRLGVKPEHRTKLNDYGECVCVIPKILYNKKRNVFVPEEGFHQFVYGTINGQYWNIIDINHHCLTREWYFKSLLRNYQSKQLK